jgi:hypothetical protein
LQKPPGDDSLRCELLLLLHENIWRWDQMRWSSVQRFP